MNLKQLSGINSQTLVAAKRDISRQVQDMDILTYSVTQHELYAYLWDRLFMLYAMRQIAHTRRSIERLWGLGTVGYYVFKGNDLLILDEADPDDYVYVMIPPTALQSDISRVKRLCNYTRALSLELRAVIARLRNRSFPVPSVPSVQVTEENVASLRLTVDKFTASAENKYLEDVLDGHSSSGSDGMSLPRVTLSHLKTGTWIVVPAMHSSNAHPATSPTMMVACKIDKSEATRVFTGLKKKWKIETIRQALDDYDLG